MAVNSYNPRLFSSSSSENDVDDVFRHKGASVVPVGSSLPKNRCFSEPVYQNGKEGMKDDSKTLGKTPALSDSSNVLRRQRGRVQSQPGSENPLGFETKSECSPIFEEVPAANLESEKSTVDSVFPEPERSREATKDAYRFSILLEGEETMDEMNPNLGQGQELGDSGLVEYSDDLDNQGMRMEALENDIYYMRDVTFGSTVGGAGVLTEGQQSLEDDNDDSYPEKECIPSGYVSYSTQDLQYVSYPWDLPRTVLPSYSDFTVDKMPELPDDLIKETDIYPVDEMESVFDSLSPVLLPSTPFAPPDCELKMKLIFGDNS